MTKNGETDFDVEKSPEQLSEEMSQKIFGKPSKDIKYVYVTNYIHHQLLEEEITRTGLYQWINVFKGEVKYPRDIVDYNDYDIVHVNMSGQDISLVGDIREAIGENSKTKLVVNNDYTTELWGTSFDFPNSIRREITNADMLFGTEYYQVTALSELSGRQCYIIPHPADIRRLKHLPKMDNKEIISTIWRRYDQHSYIPHLVTRNHGYTTQLIGYDKGKDRKPYVTTPLYDYVFEGTNYFDFCDQMRECKIVYDPFTFHSYSRATVDTAAMGVAVVGSDRTQSMKICYPYTTVDPYDVVKGRQLIEKLINDKDFYDLVVKTALERVEFYNHENSKARFLVALEESLRIKYEPTKVKNKKREKGKGADALVGLANAKNRKREKAKP